MALNPKLIQELRDMTNAGMLDAKKALDESGGDLQKAVEILRKKGLSDASKKSSRVAAEGAVTSYIHGGGKIGVLLEINCETDFVAKTPQFEELCKNIALHICASAPIVVHPDEISLATLEKEKEVLLEKAKAKGINPSKLDIYMENSIKSFINSAALMTQPYVKDPSMTVGEYIIRMISATGENIKIRRFTRFQLGEGIEKKEENFAEEVMKQIKN